MKPRKSRSNPDLQSPQVPVFLCLGNFDGVHKGHQHLLEAALQAAKKKEGKVIAFSFSNHPSWVLNKEDRSLIVPLISKLLLLKQAGVDSVYLKTFTKTFASKTTLEFFRELKEIFPIDSLVLGYDACLGKERESNREVLESHAQKAGFSILWVPPLKTAATPISSTEIRHLIQKGELQKLPLFLGRPWFWDLAPIKGSGLGKTLGFPTLNFRPRRLTLPPLGVWIIKANDEKGNSSFGLANLGFCPTLKKEPEPILEVFLFEPFQSPVYRIEFLHYLRKEQTFPSSSHLKEQIQKDVELAKSWLGSLNPR